MSSAGVRAIQSIKPHIRMIKFRHQLGTQGGNEMTSSISQAHFQPPPLASQLSNTKSTNAKEIGSTPRGTGIQDTALPEKYRRKPIDEIEIEYITRGGPA